MTDRTSSQKDTRSQAVKNIELGNISFRALCAEQPTDSATHYVIVVPKAVMRSGVFGWLSRATTSTWGKPTSFGDDLFSTLGVMENVEPGLDNDTPHILAIFVGIKMTEESPEGLRNQLKGLPKSVCVTIEEVILRNDGFGQRFAEWLRRLF